MRLWHINKFIKLDPTIPLAIYPTLDVLDMKHYIERITHDKEVWSGIMISFQSKNCCGQHHLITDFHDWLDHLEETNNTRNYL